jgi:superfamily I DNA/RNA helicase
MDPKIELSPKQQNIVEGKGKFVVKACPGSGKTFSVAARIAHLINTKKVDDYLAIAAVSFTNVACNEIQKALKEKFDIVIPLQYPHFIGTIDSFVNNFIFLPQGHLIMGCKERPELIGVPFTNWYEYDISKRKFYKNIKTNVWEIGSRDPLEYFDKTTFNKENELVAIYSKEFFPFSWDKIRKMNGDYRKDVQEIIDSKWIIFQQGKATQADANYIAYKVLTKYETITQNLTKRFSHFIIDEAQDTTDVQMGIIDILERCGARDIVLIGDPNQAIFEWNDAKPKLFDGKYRDWKRSKDYNLDENRRSSKLICDCTRRLLQIDEYDVINDDVKNYPFKPQIVGHKEEKDRERLEKIMHDYLKICIENNIPTGQDTVAILYRSHSVGEWLGIPAPEKKETPWKSGHYHVKDISYGKYLVDNGKFEEGYKNLERGYHKYMNENNNHVSRQYIDKEIEKIGYKEYRNKVFSFIELLPTTTDVNLHEWIDAANKIILSKGFSNKLIIDLNKPNKRFDELFGTLQITKDKDYFIGTIHSAKGKTFEAVLLVLGEKGGNSCYRNMINLNQGKKGLSEKQKEELRSVYVAITRPRKILVIAVPEKDCDVWQKKLKTEDSIK